MSRNILGFNTIAERKIAFSTEIGYFSTFRNYRFGGGAEGEKFYNDCFSS